MEIITYFHYCKVVRGFVIWLGKIRKITVNYFKVLSMLNETGIFGGMVKHVGDKKKSHQTQCIIWWLFSPPNVMDDFITMENWGELLYWKGVN